MAISSLQTEKDTLKDQINQLESHIALKDREVDRVTETFEENHDRLSRELRSALEEMLIAQDHAKACEGERVEMKRRLHTLEEGYKRDSDLFRNEAIKRDQDIDDERARGEQEIAKVRGQID